MFRPQFPSAPNSRPFNSTPPAAQSGGPRPPFFQSTFTQPQFTGSGTLLGDHCATAQYTLIDYGPTASYVPFIGCIDSQPECCPFTPVSTGTVDGIPVTSRRVYPRPKNARDAIVNSCPADYFSVSGSCCPNAFTPWTEALGGATPCYSALPANTTPPTSSNSVIAPRATVTITATVFAMQYAVLADDASLSPGAIAGIVIGCALGLGGLLGAFLGLRRVRQRKQNLARLRSELHDGGGAVPGSSVVPIAPGAPFRPRSPPSPVGKTEQVKLPHGELTPKVAVRAAELLAGRSRLEPIKEVRSGPSSRAMTLAHPQRDSPEHPKPAHTPSFPGSSIRATPVRFYGKAPAWQDMYLPKAPPVPPPVPVYGGKPKLALQIPSDLQPIRAYPETPTTPYPRPPPPPPPARKSQAQQRSNSRDDAHHTAGRFPVPSAPRDQGQTTTPGRFPISPPRNQRQPSSSSVTNTPDRFYATPELEPVSGNSQRGREPANGIMNRPRAAYKHPGRDLTRGGKGL